MRRHPSFSCYRNFVNLLLCFINTPCCICCKPDIFGIIKGIDSLNQANCSDGEEILCIVADCLVFFDDMSNEAQITFDKNVFCFEITLRIFLHIISFFRCCEGLGK